MAVSKLYVGNLSYSVTSDQLHELFKAHGEVKDVKIIEGKGFGFVEMSSPEEAAKAQEELDGKDFEGRAMKVNEARPPKPRGSGGGFGGGRGGGGGFGGGGGRGGGGGYGRGGGGGFGGGGGRGGGGGGRY